MHFCSNCENLYYIRIDSEDTNQLIYYCRHCGKEENNGVGSNSIIYKSTSNNNQINPNKLINKYTKLDPTLPRITNMLCPNENCITNKTKKNTEIIYMRYDEINMKYIYLCSDCDYMWEIKN